VKPSSVVAIALAAIVASTGAGSAADLPCASGRPEARLTEHLPHTAARVHGGGDLTIVALGSSSTAGYGASSRQNTYPSRLAAELRERWPRLHIEVLNKGIGGETDNDMMRRFEKDVLPYKPDLVIWQLGTNALLKEDGVTRDAPRIMAGIERLKRSGADVILMNPQYAPKVLKDPDHGEMVEMLDEVAVAEHVAMFDRFTVMREWVSTGAAEFETILSSDGLHMNDASYRCMARLLADSIVTAASPPLVAATPAAAR